MEKIGEIQEILLEILARGLLRIRAFAWAGRSQDCALEADHLHNLPGLVSQVERRELFSYYELARPEFLKRATKATEFEPYWQRIREILDEWKE
jgi:hypothetical protein